MSGLLERRVVFDRSGTQYLDGDDPPVYSKSKPSAWFPQRVKVDGYSVYRVERQVGPSSLVDYEWLIDQETGKPWEGNESAATLIALLENDQ